VKKKAYFRNFVTLVLFGVLGTMMTSALIFAGVYPLLRWLGVGAHLVPDALSLGTIFSSSDSVATLQILDQDAAPVLYSLVFGEGVVNDATSIVLLRAVQKIRYANA
jgi:NhaP-type Na+/H+ or K+/H+ antiporter